MSASRVIAGPDAAATLRVSAALEETWGDRPGFVGWLMTVNHKRVAMRTIVTAFAFFVLAGVLALLMRLQLARPEANLLGPDLYNQVFTMHGTAMMFLFAVPVMQGFGLYVSPLMVGTRNVAFPRLNAFGYWTFFFGGLLVFTAFVLNVGPDAGWFAYVPLSGPQYAPGKRVDVWSQLVSFTELAALVGAVEIIVTVLKLRAPGLSLDRLPMFVWAMLVQSVMVLFAMPAVMVATGMLAMDRLIGTHFFNPAEGGDPLLWQHLFWFFGHPEVYLIFIPALGMVSTLVVTFARRAVIGYTALVLSLVSTAFLGFGLWVHHMFVTGLPQLGQSFFTAASMMIAIPSGVQIFCWIATLATGRVRLRVPLLYVLGFVAIFVAGGLTGVMLSSEPLDRQLHDTFFVVAHFHYVLIGGAVFPLLGAVTYWFPKMTGRCLSERLGRWAFGVIFVGFNLTFFPMHVLGLHGMPRRVYTYVEGTGWGLLNALATTGTLVLAAGLLLGVVNVVLSLRHGEVATDDPWDADTLEWSVGSPPPAHNFTFPPTVAGRHPLWMATLDEPVVTGLRTDVREVLVTTVVDAEPDHRHRLHGPTVWPLLTAVSVAIGLVGVLFTPWAIPLASVPVTIALAGWFWPDGQRKQRKVAPVMGSSS